MAHQPTGPATERRLTGRLVACLRRQPFRERFEMIRLRFAAIALAVDRLFGMSDEEIERIGVFLGD